MSIPMTKEEKALFDLRKELLKYWCNCTEQELDKIKESNASLDSFIAEKIRDLLPQFNAYKKSFYLRIFDELKPYEEEEFIRRITLFQYYFCDVDKIEKGIWKTEKYFPESNCYSFEFNGEDILYKFCSQAFQSKEKKGLTTMKKYVGGKKAATSETMYGESDDEHIRFWKEYLAITEDEKRREYLKTLSRESSLEDYKTIEKFRFILYYAMEENAYKFTLKYKANQRADFNTFYQYLTLNKLKCISLDNQADEDVDPYELISYDQEPDAFSNGSKSIEQKGLKEIILKFYNSLDKEQILGKLEEEYKKVLSNDDFFQTNNLKKLFNDLTKKISEIDENEDCLTKFKVFISNPYELSCTKFNNDKNNLIFLIDVPSFLEKKYQLFSKDSENSFIKTVQNLNKFLIHLPLDNKYKGFGYYWRDLRDCCAILTILTGQTHKFYTKLLDKVEKNQNLLMMETSKPSFSRNTITVTIDKEPFSVEDLKKIANKKEDDIVAELFSKIENNHGLYVEQGKRYWSPVKFLFNLTYGKILDDLSEKDLFQSDLEYSAHRMLANTFALKIGNKKEKANEKDLSSLQKLLIEEMELKTKNHTTRNLKEDFETYKMPSIYGIRNRIIYYLCWNYALDENRNSFRTFEEIKDAVNSKLEMCGLQILDRRRYKMDWLVCILWKFEEKYNKEKPLSGYPLLNYILPIEGK